MGCSGSGVLMGTARLCLHFLTVCCYIRLATYSYLRKARTTTGLQSKLKLMLGHTLRTPDALTSRTREQ